MQVLISIAVTTYDRVDMLRETLNSILAQTYVDFEVLVGNDNPQRTVQDDFPDIDDPRVKWINNPENLGAIENTNNLIGMAKGKFITTLADDDLLAPEFLEEVNHAIEVHPDVDVFFTKYVDGEVPPSNFGSTVGETLVMSGADWLAGYLQKKFRTVGCYGVFSRQLLSSIGGVHALGSAPAFSPYNDNLMAVQAGGAQRVVFLDKPLVYFKLHSNSMSYSSRDAGAFATAQLDFLKIARPTLISGGVFQSSFRRDITRWFAGDYFSVASKSPRTSQVDMFRYYLTANGWVFSGSEKISTFYFISRTYFWSVYRKIRYKNCL